MTGAWTIQARWLFPIDAPPVPQGALTVAGDRIVAVEPRGTRTADIDLGNVAILPGLVNAHTHLDLGGLRHRRPPPDTFTKWLHAVVAYRRSSNIGEWEAAIRAGIDECLRTGTTLVGDISVGGLSGPFLAASPLRSVVFHELIGLSEARAEEAWTNAVAWLDSQRPTPGYHVGLSPHAPYSVRRSLFRRATARNLRLAVHFAESPNERELLERRRGPLREFLEELGAWDPSDLAGSLDEVLELCRIGAPVLFVHGNYIPSALFPRLYGANIVYGPRTHAYFGHSRHPFLELIQAGANVALGTDSLASNPDLNMLEEARFLRRHRPEAPPDMLLAMVTLVGAWALGWGNETGSLTVGKSADFITVPLPNRELADPHELLLDSDLPVKDVWIRGEPVVQEGKLNRALKVG